MADKVESANHEFPKVHKADIYSVKVMIKVLFTPRPADIYICDPLCEIKAKV